MVNKIRKVHVKVWIEDEDGETVFGAGQIKILQAIDENGSISAAAKQMKMGYRSMWGKIKKIEQRIGRPVLVRQKGGKSGGSSILTPSAKETIEKFKRLEQKISQEANMALKKIF